MEKKKDVCVVKLKCTASQCLAKREEAYTTENLNRLHSLSNFCFDCPVQKTSYTAALTRRSVLREFQRAFHR